MIVKSKCRITRNSVHIELSDVSKQQIAHVTKVIRSHGLKINRGVPTRNAHGVRFTMEAAGNTASLHESFITGQDGICVSNACTELADRWEWVSTQRKPFYDIRQKHADDDDDDEQEVAFVATPDGTYINLELTPESKALVTGVNMHLQLEFGIPVLEYQELHVTLNSSERSLPVRNQLWVQRGKVYDAEVTGVGVLGTFLVAYLDSEELTERHDFWLKQGIDSVYPDFVPHTSLCKMTPSFFGLHQEKIEEICDKLIGAKLFASLESIHNYRA